MNKKLFTLLLGIFAFFAAYAQTSVVKGTVIDKDGDPLIGVSIYEKGRHSVSTTTDIEGNYSISVPQNATLEFAYVGYKTVLVDVNGRTQINVTLADETTDLSEIVVVGYGVQKRSSMTASVASVSAKEMNKQIASNVASTLQGRAPGVEVLQNGADPGSDISILVRGAGSFGSTEPLYIIDGAISNNGLSSLVASDIESIEVLKDGSAAAIYGSRAANGVVLVTTKNGKAGETKVELNGSYTLQTPAKLLKFMNASQWREYANMVCDNSAAYDRATQNVNPTDPDYSTDWQDIYYNNASMYSLGAAISGGNENATFNTSLGYTDQDGIVINSGYKKYNARLNSTYKKGRFTITENLSLSHSKRLPTTTTRGIMIPTIPVTDEYGRYISTPSELGYSTTNSNITPPLASIYNTEQFTKKTDVIGALGVLVDIWGGIKYKFNISGDYLHTYGYAHTPEYATYWDADGNIDSRFSQPYTYLSESRSDKFNYTIDNLLTFNRDFGEHSFDVLLGTSWMREYYRYMSMNSGSNDLGAPTITTYNGAGQIGSDEQNSALLSFFGRVNYNYAERYLLSATIRRDESSKFAKDYRVGYFPSISAGWNIHNESWFNVSPTIINKLKIRGSYGELGANFIDPYSFTSLAYGPVPAIFGDQRVFGYVTKLAQQNLKWETAVSSNVGVEMAFLKNRLNASVEYYYRRNNDLLAPLEPLPSSGQTIIINDGDLPYFNTASVENKGIEITAGYRDTFGDWTIGIDGNITFLKNKVLKLGEGVQPIRGTIMSSKFNDRPTITQEGLPIGSFYGYKVVGINDEGNFLFEAADGTAKPASEVGETDKQVIGNPNPDFTYGLNINVGYKNWDLTAFFQGTQGNDIFAAAKYQLYFNTDINKPVDALNSWTPSNTNTNLPIANTDNYNGGNSLPSSFYIEDGSYFRCKNLQLGYTFDKDLLRKTGFIESARLYAGIQNLFTITSYSLYDPEVSSDTLFDRGVDGLETRAPRVNTRTYTIGFNLTF